MKRWVVVVLVGLIVIALWAVRLGDAHSATAGSHAAIQLDALHPTAESKPTSANNESSVAILDGHTTFNTYSGKTIDHGIMFGLNPGHGNLGSEATITFHLGKKYARLSGVAFATGGSSAAPRSIEIQDMDGRGKPPKDMYVGSVDQTSGQVTFTAAVRGVDVLAITASTSFDCVCDAGATVVVVGTLTPAQTGQHTKAG